MTVTVLVALATWRLWRLVALDSLTAPLRLRLRGRGQELVECPWCLGTWLTAGTWAVTWGAVASLPRPGLVLGAASALTGALGTVDKAWHDRG